MSETYQRADLTIDQQLALLTAARNLGEQFTGTFSTQTIERFTRCEKAVIRAFLPLLSAASTPHPTAHLPLPERPVRKEPLHER